MWLEFPGPPNVPDFSPNILVLHFAAKNGGEGGHYKFRTKKNVFFLPSEESQAQETHSEGGAGVRAHPRP